MPYDQPVISSTRHIGRVDVEYDGFLRHVVDEALHHHPGHIGGGLPVLATDGVLPRLPLCGEPGDRLADGHAGDAAAARR